MSPKKNPHISKDYMDLVKKNKDKDFLTKLENALLHASGLAGVYYHGPWEDEYLIWENKEKGGDQSINNEEPIPPLELRHFYGRNSDELYLKAGRLMYNKYKELFLKYNSAFKSKDKIMEIGCSSGRILRWFKEELNYNIGVYGADIDATAIMWAQQNLDKRFKFFINTTSPHLPFPDNYFSLIYGNSLFTHIGELSDFWFLELNRLLKSKRGIAVITFNDDRSLSYLLEQYNDVNEIPYKNPRKAIELNNDLESKGKGWNKLVFNSSPWQQSVWYNRNYLVRILESKFKILDIVEKFDAYQNAYILKKR